MDTYTTDSHGLPVIDKAAAATLDYSFDWSAYLAPLNDTITAHLVTMPAGLTKESEIEIDGVVTAWIAGGKAGNTYPVRCRITTAAGRIDERTVMLRIVAAR